MKSLPIGMNALMLKNLNQIQAVYNKLERFAEPMRRFQNSIPKINPQVLDAMAILHSKIPTIDPILLNSIQRIAERYKQIDSVMFSVLENDSFKSLVVNINNIQLDKLSEVDENDFEEFIQQLQIKDNADAIEKQVTQNPILLALLLALLIVFFEQTGSNMSDIFVKPQLEKLQDIFENNMDETRVLTNTVNLREAPKGTAKSLLKLEANQTIKVLSKSGNWFKVRYFYDTDEYIERWVFKRYVKKVGEAELK